MFDFPTNPPLGTSATTPDGAVRYWDGVKWDAAYAGPASPPDISNDLVTAQNATIARTLANRFADRYSVEDWLTPGQPDGTTDNTAQLQAALDAAAGCSGAAAGSAGYAARAAAPGNASLLFPAAAQPYIIGLNNGLQLPSNSHIIVAAGATLKIANGAAANLLGIVPSAANILIDLYGTLDGNDANAVFPCGGIVVLSGGSCSNVYVRGNRQGLIKNVWPFGCSIGSCTNGEVNGVTIDNSHASVQFAGISPLIGAITSGTYDSTSGAISITTPTPHGLVVGALFTLINVTGTGNFPALAGAYTATTGTAGTTLKCTATAGLGAATLTGGTLHGPTAPCDNVGFVDCVIKNTQDLGCALYGGVRRGYIRNCDISGCTGGGAMIFADAAQSGANINCEISGNVLWNNGAAGAFVGSNIDGIMHRDTVISDNRIFGNTGAGVFLQYADGVLVADNYLHDNFYNAPNVSSLGISGEISIHSTANRLSIIDNTIRNPMAGAVGNGYGIAFDTSNYLLISGNRIGDYRTTKSMTAALGGSWGQFGLSEGNYYGPRIATEGWFPADKSIYAFASVQGLNYDLVTGWVSGTTPQLPVNSVPALPSRGLTVGWNYSGGIPGRGEVDFFVGRDSGAPGGFDFIQVQPVVITTGTYTSGTGLVSLTTNIPHALVVGSVFALINVTGGGADLVLLSGAQTATTGTTGSTLNFTIATGRAITSITGGLVAANGGGAEGAIDITRGVAGSLMANDGFGNTRFGGALVHGSMQTGGVMPPTTLTAGGTVTIPPHTSFALIRNSASIATGTVALPNPVINGTYQGAGSELEINFQNPVGTLTLTGALEGPVPTSITAAHTSLAFVWGGSSWVRRIMQ